MQLNIRILTIDRTSSYLAAEDAGQTSWTALFEWSSSTSWITSCPVNSTSFFLDFSFYAITAGAFVWCRLDCWFSVSRPFAVAGPASTKPIMILPYKVLFRRNLSLQGRDDASDGSNSEGNLSPQNQAIIGAVVGGVALIASMSRTDHTRPNQNPTRNDNTDILPSHCRDSHLLRQKTKMGSHPKTRRSPSGPPGPAAIRQRQPVQVRFAITMDPIHASQKVHLTSSGGCSSGDTAASCDERGRGATTSVRGPIGLPNSDL